MASPPAVPLQRGTTTRTISSYWDSTGPRGPGRSQGNVVVRVVVPLWRGTGLAIGQTRGRTPRDRSPRCASISSETSVRAHQEQPALRAFEHVEDAELGVVCGIRCRDHGDISVTAVDAVNRRGDPWLAPERAADQIEEAAEECSHCLRFFSRMKWNVVNLPFLPEVLQLSREVRLFSLGAIL